jgi:predicted negative regulator of RcsB-dependent stress response
MHRPRLISFLALVLLTTAAVGQTRRPPSGNPGGTNTGNIPGNPTRSPMDVPSMSTTPRMVQLEVQLTSDGARPVPVQALVQVSQTSGGVVQANYTDMDGKVTMSIPPGGTYEITVSGPGIETTQQEFELFQGESFHHQPVTVKLTADAKANLPGGMVSASALNVPANARHEYDKGMKLMQNQKWADAKKHLEKATQEYPNFDWAFNNIGVIDTRLNDKAGAREAFTRAVAINNKNADAERNLARLELESNDYDGAKTLLKESLAVKPDDPDALGLLSYAELKTNQPDLALADAEKVHRDGHDPFPLAHLVAGTVLESKGNLAGARKEYEAYLKEAPDTPQAKAAKDGLARIQAQAKN